MPFELLRILPTQQQFLTSKQTFDLPQNVTLTNKSFNFPHKSQTFCIKIKDNTNRMCLRILGRHSNSCATITQWRKTQLFDVRLFVRSYNVFDDSGQIQKSWHGLCSRFCAFCHGTTFETDQKSGRQGTVSQCEKSRIFLPLILYVKLILVFCESKKLTFCYISRFQSLKLVTYSLEELLSFTKSKNCQKDIQNSYKLISSKIWVVEISLISIQTCEQFRGIQCPIHSVEIMEIYSQPFLAKIPWK